MHREQTAGLLIDKKSGFSVARIAAAAVLEMEAPLDMTSDEAIMITHHDARVPRPLRTTGNLSRPPLAHSATALLIAVGAVFCWTTAAAAQAPGFGVRLIDVTGSTRVFTTTEALDIAANLGSTAEPYAIQSDIVDVYDVVDLADGVGGTFDVNHRYPGGAAVPGDGIDFVVEVTADVTIPAGEWQIAFGSDEGGVMTLAGTSLAPTQNENGPPELLVAGDDTIRYEFLRFHEWTGGVFTLDEPLETTLTTTFFEWGAGSALEIAIRDASEQTAFPADPQRGWMLLQDGAEGWSVSTDKTPAHRIGGHQLIGASEWTQASARLTNEIFGAAETSSGLTADVFKVALLSSDSWEAYLAGGPLPASRGVIDQINWARFSTGVSGAGYPPAFSFPPGSDQNGYSVRVTGEIFISADGEVRFKDGVDDYAYLAIDADGDGAINPETEVLINDNSWTNVNGTANAGSPVVTADFANIAAGGEFREIEFRMGEGAGHDFGVLYWDQNEGAVPFRTSASDTSPAHPSQLIPSSAFRTEFAPLAGGDVLYVLDSGLPVIFEVNADTLAADQIFVPANPDPEMFGQMLDVDGAHIVLHVLEGELDPSETFTLVNMFHLDGIVGTPRFELPPGIWDTSAFHETGQITFVRVPEPSGLVLAVLALVGFGAIARHGLPVRLPTQGRGELGI